MDGVIRVLRVLRGLPVDALARLVAERRVPVRASSSIVDVAEFLLDDDAITAALDRLGWRELDRLDRGDVGALERAAALVLAVPDTGPDSSGAPGAGRMRVLPEVCAVLERELAVALPVPGSPADGEADARRDARGAERAHHLAVLVADLVADFDASPRAAREGRGGTRLAGVDVRRIAADMELAPELVDGLAHGMYLASLAGAVDGAWSPTALGRKLGLDSRVARWRAIVDAWLDVLGVHNRNAVLGAASPRAAVRGLNAVEAATELGLLVDGVLTSAGRLALSGDLDGAAAAIAAQLPEEIDRVYVQPDLSVVAPGPLTPEAEAKLRRVAELERRGPASTYRLSAASVSRALASGLDAAAIEASLRELSLVPLPQPVTYLVTEASARHGRIRVRPSQSTTIVRSVDADALDQLAIDQSLAALRLRRRSDGSLESLLGAEHVTAALSDARYPVIAEDEHGTPIAARRVRTAPAREVLVPAAAQRFATALHDDAQRHADGDDASAWLAQRLDRARRAKALVRIRVAIDGRPPLELRVLPASLSPKWLRVIDPDADVERTFPLSAIELLEDEAVPAGDDAR